MNSFLSSTEAQDYRLISGLEDYHYTITEFTTSMSHLTVRAYKPSYPADHLDIVFDPDFVQLPVAWENLPLQLASEGECDELVSRLVKPGQSLGGTHTRFYLFYVGSKASGLSILARDFYVRKPSANLAEADIPFLQPGPIASGPLDAISELDKIETLAYHYELRSEIDKQRVFLLLREGGIISIGRHYLMTFEGVRYLQIAPLWSGQPFQLATPEERERLLDRLALDKDEPLILLRAQMRQMPVYVLCGGVKVKKLK